jgi:hypothetical protein
MKKIVIAIALVFAGFAVNAQETVQVSSKSVAKVKQSGMFYVSVSDAITAEQVEKVKGYYKNYFDVVLNSENNQLEFKMVNTDTMSFNVVNRMLVSLNVQHILVDGKEMTFEEMMDRYYK